LSASKGREDGLLADSEASPFQVQEREKSQQIEMQQIIEEEYK